MNNETGQCARCGRVLKDARSIKRGYGPQCYKKAIVGEQTTIDEFIKE